MRPYRGRGRGRGAPSYNHYSSFSTSTGPSVPRHATIVPNTHVSIIMKQDQPTGQQVTGVVADVLTKGDHHRGIKVRLKDGRVGRVQRVLEAQPEGEGAQEQEMGGGNDAGQERGNIQGEGEREENTPFRGRGRGGGWRGGRGRGRGRGGGVLYDWRSAPAPMSGDGTARNEGTYDLTAFIREDRRGRGRGRGRGNQGFLPRGAFQQGNSSGRQQYLGEEIPLSPLGSDELLANRPKDEPVVRCPVCGDFEGDETAVQHHVEAHFI